MTRIEARAQTLEREVAELYRVHSTALRRYAGSMVSNPDEVRDAVQEVFLRYFQERRSGREIHNPGAWLFQVLRNHLLRGLKHMHTAEEFDPESLPDLNASPESLLAGRQLAQEMAATLTARERDCLRLRTDGLGYLEIAEALQIRPGTVGALMTRVHQKLSRPGGTGGEAVEALRCILWEEQLLSS